MNFSRNSKGETLTCTKTDCNQLEAVKAMGSFASKFTEGKRREIAQNLSRAASAFEAEFVNKPAVTEAGEVE